MRARAPLAAIAALACAAGLVLWGSRALAADTVVVLTTGERIVATSAERKGDVVEVTLPTGDFLSYPLSMVETIELSAPPPEPISGPELAPPLNPPPRNLSGPVLPKPKDQRPQNLSGPALQPKSAAEQQAVFTAPYQPPAPIIDPTWTPTSAYDMNEDVLANGRVQWQKPIVDPTWTPTSAYDQNADVLADSRVQWQKPIIDSSWQPTDAFSQ